MTASRAATADRHSAIGNVTRFVDGRATQLREGGNDIGAGAAFGMYQSANGAEGLGLVRRGSSSKTHRSRRGCIAFGSHERPFHRLGGTRGAR